MLENNVYNLMSQLIQESQSLWRIKNEYKKDSEECSSCAAYWTELEMQKEENVRKLEELIRDHLVSPDMPKERTHPYEP